MSIVAPIPELEDTEEIRERIWGSYCSLWARGLQVIPSSFASLEDTGETLSPSLSDIETTGIGLTPVYGELEAGERTYPPSMSSMDTGLYSPLDASYGSAEISGSLLWVALAMLEPGVAGSTLFVFAALASLAAKYEIKSPSPSSMAVRNRGVRESRVAVAVRGERRDSVRASWQIGVNSALPALASLDDGNKLTDSAYGALDSQDGEGIDFIVDIQDEILATGEGEP